METLTNVLLIISMLGSLGLPIFGWVDMCRFTKRMKADDEKTKKLIDKKCKEIEDGIGKELAKALEENTRLKKLCDRTLATAEEQDKKIEQLQAENEQLKAKGKEKQGKK